MKPLPVHDLAAIRDPLWVGRTNAQGAMRAGPIVMVEILAQDLEQVALAQEFRGS